MTAENSSPKGSAKTRTALRVALFYVLIAALWILFSDQLAAWLIPDPAFLLRLQTVKGWLFVLVTGGLLYLYLDRCLHQMQSIEEAGRQRVEEQHRQMANLFDSFNAIIYVADMQTHELLFVNCYAARIFGEDWQGKSCFNYLQNGLETPCGVCTNPQLAKHGAQGPAMIWEFQNTRNKRWYECMDKAIQWGDGRLARLEIALDITERKELERTKDELLSVVSHEMRTPLTAITGFAELLLDDPEVPPHVSQQLQIIFREAEKMGDLVNTFLDIRRFKTDRSRTDYERLPVTEILRKGSQNCRDCTANHQVEITGATDLAVFGNRKELTSVISQLVNNACRFSPEGATITLSADLDGDEVRIRVADTGPGIPPEEQKKIFERFHRLDTGDTRRSRGLGLGLSLAKQTVELHGGRIWVTSHPGQGSCFQVALPRDQEDRAPETPLPTADSAEPGPR